MTKLLETVGSYHARMRFNNCNMVMMGMYKTDKNGIQTELYKRGYVASYQNPSEAVGEYPDTCWSHRYFKTEKEARGYLKTK